VKFPIVDDGKVLQLARGTPGASLKRWKILTTNQNGGQAARGDGQNEFDDEADQECEGWTDKDLSFSGYSVPLTS
jgi:hypothetical protein